MVRYPLPNTLIHQTQHNGFQLFGLLIDEHFILDSFDRQALPLAGSSDQIELGEPIAIKKILGYLIDCLRNCYG